MDGRLRHRSRFEKPIGGAKRIRLSLVYTPMIPFLIALLLAPLPMIALLAPLVVFARTNGSPG
jgi:hypothetical protein